VTRKNFPNTIILIFTLALVLLLLSLFTSRLILITFPLYLFSPDYSRSTSTTKEKRNRLFLASLLLQLSKSLAERP
jgi:hypothetical protein